MINNMKVGIMDMKKGLSLVVLVLLLFLFGCSKENTNLSIKEINGYQDAVIDTENKSISLMVDNDVDSFLISDIVVENNISVSVYSDANYSNKLGDTITLNEGLNVYYLRLSLIEDNDVITDYTLNITREEYVRELLNIEVVELQKEYKLNTAFVNGILKLNYNDNSSENITLTSDMVSGFDTSTVGKKTLTITYEDKSITYEIEVVRSLIRIEVMELNKTYYVNDKFTNGLLTLVYDDGSSENITLTSDMNTGFGTTTVGKKTLTITYEDKTITYEIEVVNDKITNIEVLNLANSYKFGQELNLTNAKLKVSYLSGKVEEVSLTKDMISGFSSNQVGTDFELVITYNGFVVKYKYNVENTVLSIAVKELNNKYYLDDEFKEGLLTVNYADNSSKDIALTLDMVSGFDTTSVGTKTLTITYEDKSINYIIEVAEKVVLENVILGEYTKTYKLNEGFNIAKLVLVYSDGTKKSLDVTSDMLSGFDTTSTGDKEVIITYEDFKIKMTINVIGYVIDPIYKIPTKSNISTDDTIRFMAGIYTFIAIYDGNFGVVSFDSIYEGCLEYLSSSTKKVEEYQKILSECGITKTEVDGFVTILNKTAKEFIDHFCALANDTSIDISDYDKTLELLLSFFTVEKTNALMQDLLDIINLIGPNNITPLVKYLIDTYKTSDEEQEPDSFIIMGEDLLKIYDLNMAELLKYLAMNNVDSGSIELVTNNYETTLTNQDVKQFVNFTYGLIYVLNYTDEQLTNDLINKAIELLLGTMSRIDTTNIKVEIINQLGQLLPTIASFDDTLFGLDKVLDVIYNAGYFKYFYEESINYLLIEIFKSVIKYDEAVAEVLSNLDVDVVDNLNELMTASYQDFRCFQDIINWIKPLISVALNDEGLKELTGQILVFLDITGNSNPIDEILDRYLTLADLDFSNMTDDEVKQIGRTYNYINIISYIWPNLENTMLSSDLTEDQMIETLLKDHSSTYFSMEGNKDATLTKENIILNYNHKPGLQIGTIIYENTKTYFEYFVYEGDSAFNIVSLNYIELINQIYVFEQDKTFVKCYDKTNSSLTKEPELEAVFRYQDSRYYFDNEYKTPYEYVLEDMTPGLHLGYLIFNSYADVIIPIQYFVKGETPTVTSELQITVKTYNNDAHVYNDVVILENDDRIKTLSIKVWFNFESEIEDTFSGDDVYVSEGWNELNLECSKYDYKYVFKIKVYKAEYADYSDEIAYVTNPLGVNSLRFSEDGNEPLHDDLIEIIFKDGRNSYFNYSDFENMVSVNYPTATIKFNVKPNEMKREFTILTKSYGYSEYVSLVVEDENEVYFTGNILSSIYLKGYKEHYNLNISGLEYIELNEGEELIIEDIFINITKINFINVVDNSSFEITSNFYEELLNRGYKLELETNKNYLNLVIYDKNEICSFEYEIASIGAR